ncbi:alpha/beta hydrolase family protein [Spirosoma pomorum]
MKLTNMLLLVSGFLLFTQSSCRVDEVTQPEEVVPARTLISSTPIAQYTVAQLRSNYTGVLSALQFFIRHGIKVYKLEYTTTNTDGKSVTASGVMIVPAPENGTASVPIMSMQHGTILSDSDAPSYFQSSSEVTTFGSVFASQGYIIVAPDYIGYGSSKDLPHTYEQRNGLATASLDMLRAARNFLSDNTASNVSWNKRLFLAGYSEGGYATLALQKKIEEETKGEFDLVASSCGAGAYDKPTFMRTIVNEQTSGIAGINRLYVWVLQTYNRVYGLNRPMSYYFKEPYASQIASQGVNANINVSLNTTFTDSFKQAINNGTDTDFLKAVQDNDIHDWKPSTPTRLYHGDADETVLFQNSQNTYDAMQKRGATNVALYRLAGRTHATGILDFVLGTYNFFGTLNQ